MKIGKGILLFLLFLFLSATLQSQVLNPVKWENSIKKNSDNTYDLVFTAKIQKGWHLYGLNIADGGPVRTSVNFKNTNSIELIGNTKSSIKPDKKYDSTFAMDVELFEGTVSFSQKLKLKVPKATVEGFVEFMVCDNSRCLPPTNNDFSFSLENSISADNKQTEKTTTETDTGSSVPVNDTISTLTTSSKGVSKNNDKAGESLWQIFWGAVAKGILSVFTPCVFPIIPLIVAFFMRDNSTRKRIYQAILFGLTIITFYISVGLFAGILKIDLTLLSKFPTTNFILFLLLFLVALSFFGMFEIILPGKLSNKLDQQVDKGGLLAPFFLALATVVVSFSCVGPIAGAAIATALKGDIIKPVIAMFGFSLSFSFPFIVIGIFPALLKKLPKSGGWLNSVKVVFAFIIFGTSFIFLGNIRFGIFTRDVILSIEIVTFALLGFYLLGKFKLPHDSDLPHIKVPRLILAILSFSFAIYMFPGLLGSPLKAISSYLPSSETSELKISSAPAITTDNQSALCNKVPKYSGKYHLPYNLASYFDYNEGIACAKEKDMPVLLYFTGYSCKNCKNMYSEVWSDQRVMDKLRNQFVIISLYVDDFTDLAENDKYISDQSGKEITTIGKKNLEFEISRYGTNSQPLFVILNTREDVLTEKEAYTYSSNIDEFLLFLDEGIQNYESSMK